MDGPLPVVIGCLVFYALGFGVYAKFLAGRIFRLDAARPTPAHLIDSHTSCTVTPGERESISLNSLTWTMTMLTIGGRRTDRRDMRRAVR